jgi:hypothetical protein
MSNESCMPPPGIFLMPMSDSSRSFWSRHSTASTTILEKNGFSEWISFEDIEVEAHLRRSERKRLTQMVNGLSPSKSGRWVRTQDRTCLL